MGAEETKSKIINCTIELIKERGGDISNVTIRLIADRAGIGVGLTNHYFQSKELLIAECINTVFGDIYTLCVSTADTKEDPKAAVKAAAEKILNFFYANEALARVMISNDCNLPDGEDYTSKLVNALAYTMIDRNELERLLSNQTLSDRMKQQMRNNLISEQKVKAFIIVAALKDTFTRRSIMPAFMGVNLKKEASRHEYVEEIVELVLKQ